MIISWKLSIPLFFHWLNIYFTDRMFKLLPDHVLACTYTPDLESAKPKYRYNLFFLQFSHTWEAYVEARCKPLFCVLRQVIYYKLLIRKLTGQHYAGCRKANAADMYAENCSLPLLGKQFKLFFEFQSDRCCFLCVVDDITEHGRPVAHSLDKPPWPAGCNERTSPQAKV